MRDVFSRALTRLRHPLVLIPIALLMIGTVFLPATVWKSPSTDIDQVGFDSVLMYSDTTAADGSPAAIQMTPSKTTITSLEGSQAVLHLVTSPLSFHSTTDFRVTRADNGS